MYHSLSDNAPEIFELLESFESEWQAGRPPSIRERMDSCAVLTLEQQRSILSELVAIDLWHRWTESAPAVGTTDLSDLGPPSRPQLSDYVAQFPSLGPLSSVPAHSSNLLPAATSAFGDVIAGYSTVRKSDLSTVKRSAHSNRLDNVATPTCDIRWGQTVDKQVGWCVCLVLIQPHHSPTVANVGHRAIERTFADGQTSDGLRVLVEYPCGRSPHMRLSVSV
jgi:hypothetical protein